MPEPSMLTNAPARVISSRSYLTGRSSSAARAVSISPSRWSTSSASSSASEWACSSLSYSARSASAVATSSSLIATSSPEIVGGDLHPFPAFGSDSIAFTLKPFSNKPIEQHRILQPAAIVLLEQRAMASPAGRDLEHAGLSAVVVENRPNREALQERAPCDVFRELLTGDARLDAADVRLAQHQAVERNVTRLAETDFLL